MAAGLLVMSPLLLAELDHVATRELGREAAVSAVDDLRRWMGLARVVIPETAEYHLGAAGSVRVHRGALVEVLSPRRSWATHSAAASANAIRLSEGTGRLRAHSCDGCG